ncbi:YqeG family HAD IIIA-type phosphatase [Desmospora profundinema]|uniref:HAD superfamily phosphatase (TIGR01668 family) n=1 Tax=Desmospora profundinema TaxID=1571184 RepID=A0ABU1IK30_9BACL|nr:YqeG family HAD IIIA-type phosphatase [Desmospora profundinema]MDR6225118.1 HAD superfamily phosphatase (TIGR01668 family) [Desmospora profundinema]
MLKRIIPDEFVESIYDIDYNALQRRGVKAIIVDLDNTLVEADRPDATPKLISWLDQLQGMGFKVMIVSNNTRTRVSRFATPLRVPWIHAAKKPLLSAFNRAMRQLETTPEETVMVGDQLFTDVLGGNRRGMHTILVLPVSEVEGIFTKVNRLMERVVFRWMKQRGLLGWEDRK